MSAAAKVPAESVHSLEQTLFHILLQLILIIIVARVAGEAARRVGQPRAVGEIVAGLVLGPSLFGALFPGAAGWIFESVSNLPMHIVSQLGLILLMFQIGMDFEFAHLKAPRNRRAVAFISAACIALPFGLGVLIGWLSRPALAPGIPLLPYCLFLGTALSITAVPILGRIMREFDLTRTHVGAIAISSAAVNDVVGWILLAVITSMSTERFSLTDMLLQLGLLALYVVVCLTLVRPLIKRLITRYRARQGEPLSGTLMAIMLVAIFASGVATFQLGIFAIFGGFMMGVLVHDEPQFVERWKTSVGSFVTVFFLPIFFTFTGLRTNVAGLDSAGLWLWCAVMVGAAVFGKVFGAYAGARLAGLSRSQSGTIGVLMNTRALMELIVLNVGLNAGFIPPDVFTMLVVMAVSTTIMTGPGLRSLLPRMGHAIPRGIDA